MFWPSSLETQGGVSVYGYEEVGNPDPTPSASAPALPSSVSALPMLPNVTDPVNRVMPTAPMAITANPNLYDYTAADPTNTDAI